METAVGICAVFLERFAVLYELYRDVVEMCGSLTFC